MQKYWLGSLGLFVASALVGCNQKSDATTGTLTGRIEISAGTPATSCLILLEGTPLGGECSESGSFSIERIPAGNYTLRVLPDRGQSMVPVWRQSVGVNRGETTNLSTISLSRTGSIGGRVTGGEGSPEGYLVTVSGLGGVTAPNSQGVYLLPNLPPGDSYSVVLLAPPGSVVRNDVGVFPDHPTTGVDFDLANRETNPATVNGRVRREDGLPDRAEVQLLNPYNGTPVSTTNPDEVMGSFQLSTVPPGYYILRAHVPGSMVRVDEAVVLASGQNLTLDHDLVLVTSSGFDPSDPRNRDSDGDGLPDLIDLAPSGGDTLDDDRKTPTDDGENVSCTSTADCTQHCPHVNPTSPAATCENGICANCREIGIPSDGGAGDGGVSMDMTMPDMTTTPAGCIASIGSSDYSTCATKANGELWCWGDNQYSQNGNNTTAPTTVPVLVNAVSGFGAPGHVSGKNYTMAALNAAGTPYGWGENYYGHTGVITTTWETARVPTVIAGLTGPMKRIAVGYNHACAVAQTGDVYCWGEHSSLQLGPEAVSWEYNTPAINFNHVKKQAAGQFFSAIDVSAGSNSTCLLRGSDGTVWCFGNAQDGNGGTTETPTKVFKDIAVQLDNVTKLATGTSTSCAITSPSGELFCWGANGNGEMGSGDNNTSYIAKKVVTTMGGPGMTGMTSVGIGQYHGCASRNDGTVWCWGYNAQGQLGDNSTDSTVVAVQVVTSTGPLTGAKSVALGVFHSCAITQAGASAEKIYCWGSNTNNQLGNGIGSASLSQSQVATAVDTVDVALNCP